MLKSLNNKYLTLPGLSDNVTAKLSILKNNQILPALPHVSAGQGGVNSVATISPQEKSLESMPPHMANLLLSHLKSKLDAISLPNISKVKTAKNKRQQEVINATQLGRIAKIKEQILALSVLVKAQSHNSKKAGKSYHLSLPSLPCPGLPGHRIRRAGRPGSVGMEGGQAKEGGRVARNGRALLHPLNFNLFDTQLKNKVIKFLRLPLAERSNSIKPVQVNSKISMKVTHVQDPSLTAIIPQGKGKGLKWSNDNTGAYNLSMSTTNLGSVATSGLAIPALQSRRLGRHSDNKRFLFLYFIVPIFLATLKSSTAAPESRQIALNYQTKQLRSLIKLMLASGSVLRHQ
jgi:hypothetical protein